MMTCKDLIINMLVPKYTHTVKHVIDALVNEYKYSHRRYGNSTRI